MEKDLNRQFEKVRAYDPALGLPPTDEIAEAYDAVRRDPGSRARHEAELAFDAAFRARLNTIPVPPELAQSIKKAVAGLPSAELAANDSRQDSYRTPGWWLHVGLLGSMAAAIIGLIIAYAFFINPFEARATPELNAMVEGIEASLARHEGMYFAEDYGKLVEYLSESTAPIPASLPEGISAENSFACRKVIVDGAEVAMLCFRRNDATFHLFTFARENLPRQADVPRPIISEFPKNRCATWTDRENIYVLATDAPRKVLLSALSE